MYVSYNEKIDMLLIFVERKRNACEAAILYATRYPQRYHPCATMFYNIEKNLRNYGEFEKKKRNKPHLSTTASFPPKENRRVQLVTEIRKSIRLEKR